MLKEVKQKIAEVVARVGRSLSDVQIIAVSKGRTIGSIQQLYDLGVKNFAENRLNEALLKQSQLSSSIRWHFIGPLQKNKVKRAVNRFVLIHSVADVELAAKIDASSRSSGIISSILLQVNTSLEPTKQGLTIEQWLFGFETLLEMKNISIEGLMTIGPHTEDRGRIRSCFAALRKLKDKLQIMAGDRAHLRHLSMGMSNDFVEAIEEGATLVRLGRIVFE